MVNQEQNPPQQEQPFVATKQVGFNLEDIILNTNDEVDLLYPEHNNEDYFKCVSDFISKCCLRKPFTRSPNMYKEYLAEFWYLANALENSKVSFSIPTGSIFGEVGVNTFKYALGAHYLPLSSEYVAPPSIDEDIIIKLKKKQREKVVPYTRFLSLLIRHIMKEGYKDDKVTLYPTQVFSVNNWSQKPNQREEPPFIDHLLAICAAYKPMVFKAPKTSSKAKSVSQGIKHGAKTGHKTLLTSSKQPFVSSKEATKGGSSKASSKDQQAIGGLTSLGVTSEERANPQLSSGNDASAVSAADVSPGNSAPSDFVPQQLDQTKSVSVGLEAVLTQPITGKRASLVDSKIKEETSNTIKLEDLEKLMSHVQPSFKDLESPEDYPVIIMNDSDEDEDDEVHTTKNVKTKDTSVPKTSYPIRAEKEHLNKQQQNPTTPPTTPIITTTTTLKGSFQTEGEHIKKDKGKKALSSEEVVKESTKSDSDDDEIHQSGCMVESSMIKKKIEKEAKAEVAKQESKVRKEELIDLLSSEMVNKYYNDKLQYDRYCDKMLNRRAVSRITNCDVLTIKGPITLKVYREDGTSKIVSNFKASDLYLGE
uniref:Uncharacterized protein n=1 Tax=Tanacetum cinerariifolium TaxID=118510 RepID=A0A6L2N663_TANCI|nr:hypothetical protein [Tanacetum cinerariifolium]